MITVLIFYTFHPVGECRSSPVHVRLYELLTIDQLPLTANIDTRSVLRGMGIIRAEASGLAL